jgi:hypothetical protein
MINSLLNLFDKVLVVAVGNWVGLLLREQELHRTEKLAPGSDAGAFLCIVFNVHPVMHFSCKYALPVQNGGRPPMIRTMKSQFVER